MLVLTDDELTCISAAQASAWPIPLGGERAGDDFTASARSGERSLAARQLLGRGPDGTVGLVADVLGFVRPGLTSEPELVLFVADSHLQWVLDAPAVVVHAGTPAVLEVRSSAGLHHFVSPGEDGLRAGLVTFVRAAHETGYPQAGVEGIALCVVSPVSGTLFRVAKGSVTTGARVVSGIRDTDWHECDVDDVLRVIAEI